MDKLPLKIVLNLFWPLIQDTVPRFKSKGSLDLKRLGLLEKSLPRIKNG
jgi:hypothetical protein